MMLLKEMECNEVVTLLLYLYGAVVPQVPSLTQTVTPNLRLSW